MIIELEMKCFRKVVEDKMIFTEGLNVIRGKNEASKSTRFEAILYALYGAKALRSPLADAVTWGRKESELKVVLKMKVGPYTYTFTRSKAGAECLKSDESNVGGELTTGQAEVSKLAADILGADLKASSSLMMASQNALRGALDEGPAAVSMLMSKLADFDLIDRLLDKANSTLLTGSPLQIQQQLESAKSSLEFCQTIQTGDPSTCISELDFIKAKSAEEKVKQGVVAKQLADLENKRLTMRQHDARYSELCKAVGELAQRLEGWKQREAKAMATPKVDDAYVAELEKNLEFAQAHNRQAARGRDFARVVYPQVFWDKPKEDFDAELAKVKADIDRLGGVIGTVDVQINQLAGALMKDGRCPTCGHDAGDPAHREKHNAEVNAKVQALRAERSKLSQQLADVSSDCRAMEGVIADARAYHAAAGAFEPMVAWDHSTYPSKATWTGASQGIDTASLEADLKVQRAALAAWKEALQVQVTVQSFCAELQAQIDATSKEAREVVAPYGGTPPNFTAINAEILELAQQMHACNVEIQSLHERELETAQRLAEINRAIKEKADRIAQAEAHIASYTEQIKIIEFNNALMKKLKAMKPMITDYLWGQVLKAVGLFFSQMRGEQSVVTKDADGFKVNGSSISGLSGSTLDVLALAIRCALVKTFIPHAAFLVLDEPAAGCDESRTSSVLGFVASVGFAQTIMASHDPLSESVADNVISLGV